MPGLQLLLPLVLLDLLILMLLLHLRVFPQSLHPRMQVCSIKNDLITLDELLFYLLD
jgi:hypothetical protein